MYSLVIAHAPSDPLAHLDGALFMTEAFFDLPLDLQLGCQLDLPLSFMPLLAPFSLKKERHFSLIFDIQTPSAAEPAVCPESWCTWTQSVF